jgi:hypothetical protein
LCSSIARMCGMLEFFARKKAKNVNILNVLVENVAHVHDAPVQVVNTLNVLVEDAPVQVVNTLNVLVEDAPVQVVNTLNVLVEDAPVQVVNTLNVLVEDAPVQVVNILNVLVEDAPVQVVNTLNVSLNEVEVAMLKSSEDAWEQAVRASQDEVAHESLECSEVMSIQDRCHDASTCTADDTADDWNNGIQDTVSYIN